jgi:hypothetical protein
MNNDVKFLAEAYQKVVEGMAPKYVEMQDGRNMVDISEIPDKTALFGFVMDRPRLKEQFKEVLRSNDMSSVFNFIKHLDKEIISNGHQKDYLAYVSREQIHAQSPRAKQDYENLKQSINQEAGV